jgi:hypothetical protein
MSKSGSVFSSAIVALFLVAAQVRPAGAAIIDRLTIKNESTDAAVTYVIHKTSGLEEEGCVRRGHAHSDGFLFKPVNVYLTLWRTDGACGTGRQSWHWKVPYTAPQMTITVTGSIERGSISHSTHH